MDSFRRDLIKLSVIAAASLVVGGCSDSSEEYLILPDPLDDEPSADLKDTEECCEDPVECCEEYDEEEVVLADPLTVALYPDDTMIEQDIRQIFLKFNESIDSQTLDEHIYLSDKTGSLIETHTVTIDSEDPSGQIVVIDLESDYHLNESWKYTIVVTNQVKSISGDSLSDTVSLEFYTSSKDPFEAIDSNEVQRTKIVIISDLHMNEQRGLDDSYSLFTQNGELLVDFLEQVRTSDQTKELVILGDLMDMWVIPMAYQTYRDTTADTEAYFLTLSEASVNQDVINKINEIANEELIRFSYVPGNHDMLFTEEIFSMIFPKGHWQGVEPGTGRYFPEPSVVLEHGHNYDLYNAPDTVTTEGSILPPGYFITRIYATGNLQSTEKLKIEMEATEDLSQELIYTTSWDLAVASINIPSFDSTKAQIYTHVDGYTQLYSSNEARDIYTHNIASNWKERQERNGVRVPNSVIVGIMNGSGKFLWFGTLEYSAIAQYFTQDSEIRIVVFGHTHHAMLKQNWETLDNIYANTGTWVDSQYLNDGALTGTCIVLNTSASSGSDLDNVTFYQAVSDADDKMILKKIDEKNTVHASTLTPRGKITLKNSDDAKPSRQSR